MNKDEKIQTVNKKTGEVKEGYFVYIPYAKSKLIGTRWMMTFQDSLVRIAKDKDITGETFRVMFLLIGNLDFENYINIKQIEIAKQLNIRDSNVSRAMRLLVNKGIILKVKDGTTVGYKPNPYYGWKGSAANRNAEIDRIVEQRIIDLQKYRDAIESKEK